jgi:hypothetical protein
VDVLAAVKSAKAYLADVLEMSAEHRIGGGAHGPLNHQLTLSWQRGSPSSSSSSSSVSSTPTPPPN